MDVNVIYTRMECVKFLRIPCWIDPMAMKSIDGGWWAGVYDTLHLFSFSILAFYFGHCFFFKWMILFICIHNEYKLNIGTL
jgi:hypothetical protein